MRGAYCLWLLGCMLKGSIFNLDNLAMYYLFSLRRASAGFSLLRTSYLIHTKKTRVPLFLLAAAALSLRGSGVHVVCGADICIYTCMVTVGPIFIVERGSCIKTLIACPSLVCSLRYVVIGGKRNFFKRM